MDLGRARFLLAVFVASLVLGSLTSAYARTPDVTFEFGEQVSPQDEWLIREGLTLAQSYARDVLDVELQGSITVIVETNPGATYSSYSSNETINISSTNQEWVDAPALFRLEIAVHEYFHVLQHQLAGKNDFGPSWLTEGTAHAVAFQAIAATGLVGLTSIVDYWTLNALGPAVEDIPLEDLAPRNLMASENCCLYDIEPLAAYRLLNVSGLPGFAAYYRAVGDRTSPKAWQQAFSETFGQPIDTYYADFALFRQQLEVVGFDLAALAYPQVDLDGAADVTITSISSAITRGEQALLTAVTDPGVACTMTFVTPGENGRVLNRIVRANSEGVAFWFWTIRQSDREGQGTVSVTCGSSPAFAPVEIS